MKKINIQNEANIGAKGTHIHRNNKPVICLETGDVFVSLLDAAEHIGCHYSNLSAHLRGKQRSCNGKHYCYLSRVNESLDAIVTRLRETSAIEADAKKWQAYQAEQEAIRKAKEKHDADIAKADEKIAKCTEIRDRLVAQLAEAESNLMQAEIEREALDNVEEEAA